MMRAALYLRSSKDRADMSIDAQRRQLQELAVQRDIIIVAEYADAVESGKDDDRPAFQNLLRDMRNLKRGWDCVLVLDTARIARRRHISIIFEEHECKRNNIRVIYKSLPDSDPITEMLLKSILQAMDEWHSLTSKVKGLAGMAENVKQGWRAGGRAPRGYQLALTDTGTIRDGVPVTKSKLILADDALLIRAYLQARARGLPRAKALISANLDIAITSLIGIERNALTYAGHTVWNRHAERQPGGYLGGQKYRPRKDWVIQKNTHEALISEDDAETILAAVGEGSKTRQRETEYLLTGLLKSPDGRNWHGNKNAYRLGKGKQIAAHIVEKAILSQLTTDLSGDDMAAALLKKYQEYAKNSLVKADVIVLQKKMRAIDMQIEKLADLIGQTTKPAALLRKIEMLEDEREQVTQALANELEAQKTEKTIRNIGVTEIKQALRGLLGSVDGQQEGMKEAIGQFVQQIVLTDDAQNATIHYKLTAQSRVKLASPRVTELNPTFYVSSVVYFRPKRALA